MGGSSYIKLPDDIRNKKAVIDSQNIDQQCFKWAILTKHIDEYRNQTMFTDKKEHLYNFSGLKFSTPDIKIFERNNLNVSINVCSLKQNKKNHNIYSLKVVDEEKKDRFDLLLITDGDKSHYTYISNFSRFVRAKKTYHKETVLFCKRCFTSFDNQPLKNTLYG
jgi:hypothetical protein